MQLQPPVLISCPACGEPVGITVRVDGVRLEDAPGGQRLYPKISAGSILHTCRPKKTP
jgi:hypothetical protein